MLSILLLLGGLDYSCDPLRLVTNLGYVCEIIVERSKPKTYTIMTHHGPVGPLTTCHMTEVMASDGFCEKKSFILKYETVVEYRAPVPWSIPTKFGLYRPPNAIYVCDTGWEMNTQGICEYSYQRRIYKGK